MEFVERFAIFLVFAFSVQALPEDGVQERSGPFVINSYNYPGYLFKIEDNGEAWIRNEGGDKFFIVSPGLSGANGSISFESADAPGNYLRHKNNLMFLHPYIEDDLYKKDATFLPTEDKFYPGYTVYESVNFPWYYIRHENYRLKIWRDDGYELLHEDASFATSVECKAPMEFNSCGSACPNTCEEQDGPCTRNCVEGCFCPSGTVLHDGGCIALEDCPEDPTPDEGWYAPGNGFEYTVMKKRQNVDNCKKTCTGVGGYLATNGLEEASVRQDISSSAKGKKLTWTGLPGKNGKCFLVKKKQKSVSLKKSACKIKAACLCERVVQTVLRKY